VFVETGAGSVGWRRVVAVCPACAGPRPGLPLAGFARLLGGVVVTQDDTARPYDPVRPFDLSAEATAAAAAQVSGGTPHSAAATPALDGVTHAELVPVLTAEVALLQARLDEVQRQLVRLTDN
jgi:hypothetical protein